MSLEARRELIQSIAQRYHQASKADKKSILNELVATTGYHRKSATRLLNTALFNTSFLLLQTGVRWKRGLVGREQPPHTGRGAVVSFGASTASFFAKLMRSIESDWLIRVESFTLAVPDQDSSGSLCLSFWTRVGIPSPTLPLSTMRQIGKYEILGELGKGGMGTVYRGRDAIIGRDVAIKIIKESVLDDSQIEQRFYREARAAGQLLHENITILFEVGEENGTPYLVMEYLEGEDLHQILSADQFISLETKLLIALQICRGLQYAHEYEIIHRDIKPSNIRVLPNGKIKIMDFGIARIQSEEQSLTQTNISVGTPRYMSPEQIKREQVDHRTDIWSFGVILYEMLTGEHPFKGDYQAAFDYSVVNQDHEPLIALIPDVPESLEHLVDKTLAKNPEERYQDFAEVIRDLQSLLIPRDHTVPLPILEKSRVSEKKKRWATLGVLLVVGLMVGGYFAFGLLSRAGDETAQPPNQPETISEDRPNADAPPEETSTDETQLLAPKQTEASEDPKETTPPPDNTNRLAAEQERRAMDQARQPIIGRSNEFAVATLYQMAQEARQTGTRQFEAENFVEATSSFRIAGELFVQIRQVLDEKDRALTEANQPEVIQEEVQQPQDEQPEANEQLPPQPQTTGDRTEADQARTAMQTAKSSVRAPLRQMPLYQRALEVESQGDEAFDAGAFDRAATRFGEAKTLFEEAAAMQTPEEAANAAVQAIVQRLKMSLEREDANGMRAIHAFYEGWDRFFDASDDITAHVLTGVVQVNGSRAIVDIQVQLDFRDDKNLREQRPVSYIWTLENLNDQWILTNVTPR